ncbi:MAG: hypothetical protein SPF89_01455 [Sphaerochaetaceae bacterium]|nr:hypothetical protein [Spirochaetales bacterium]MDY5498751.1 hypothetical protein [Sphaerochaetaceae bacterium]
MRRRLLAILLLFLDASLFAGVSDMRDDQHRGMGVRGIALSDSYGTMFANPASLVFNPGSISASLWVTDNGYVNEPASGLMLSFCGKRMGFTLEQTTEFTKREDNLYNALKYTYLRMDWAYNWKRLSFGLSLNAQTAMKRTSIEIDAGRELTDLAVQTFFSRYETKPNSTKVTAALGAMLDMDWFTIGVVSDQFAEASDEGSLEFSGKDLYENLCFGFSLYSPTFNHRSQLNLFKAGVSMELIHPFQDASTLRGGIDLKMQMLSDAQIDFMAGWQQPFSTDELFGMDWTEATQSIGVLVTLQGWRINAYAEFPAKLYEGDGSARDVQTTVSFSFSR